MSEERGVWERFSSSPAIGNISHSSCEPSRDVRVPGTILRILFSPHELFQDKYLLWRHTFPSPTHTYITVLPRLNNCYMNITFLLYQDYFLPLFIIHFRPVFMFVFTHNIKIFLQCITLTRDFPFSLISGLLCAPCNHCFVPPRHRTCPSHHLPTL